MRLKRLSEQLKIVPLLRSANINAGTDTDSVDMSEAEHVMFLLSFGACAGAAGAIIKVYEGTSHGSKGTALTFNYRYGSAAVGVATVDVYSAWATSAALAIATATIANRELIIELDAAEMDDGYRYLTLEIGAEADSGVLHVEAILTPTYLSNAIPTVID